MLESMGELRCPGEFTRAHVGCIGACAVLTSSPRNLRDRDRLMH